MSLAQTQIYWSDDRTGFYLSPRVQSHHVFDAMLNQLQRADDLIISSFAVNDQYVRRIINHRQLISHITLILDFTVASRNPAITDFASANVDLLLLTSNHSKTIYMRSGNEQMLAVMSNNATNNARFESGIILHNHPSIAHYLTAIDHLKQRSVVW